MIPIIFVNCDRHPFLDWFISGYKLDETRTRDMLHTLAGHRVLLAETSRKHPPIVRASAVIGSAREVRSLREWNILRSRHRIPEGSPYDWTPETKVKYLYPITGVVACHPFTPPEDVRHGRVWMEYHPV